MKLRLVHFSAKPFAFDPKRQYRGSNHPFKPHGLWLSDETEKGWRAWCEAEQFELGRLTYSTEFECDLSRWLVLRNYSQIEEFTEEYTVDNTLKDIDWYLVKENFSGILITPYVWSARMKFLWYYGWDCASGCVWDLKTIKPVTASCSRPSVDLVGSTSP